jgi:hypothetical protein
VHDRAPHLPVTLRLTWHPLPLCLGQHCVPLPGLLAARNHHPFKVGLYQIATSLPSPASVRFFLEGSVLCN